MFVALAACSVSVTAPQTVNAATRACRGERVTQPPEGYGSIIAALRVSGVTCATGFKVAQSEGSGFRLPRGWSCQSGERMVCRRGRKSVSWIYAGDAG